MIYTAIRLDGPGGLLAIVRLSVPLDFEFSIKRIARGIELLKKITII